MPAEPIEHIHQVCRKPHAHRHVAYGVLEDQVPADDPGDQLAHGCVSVGIGAACNRDHRGQFRVTKCGEPTHDCNQDKRQGQCGTSPWPPLGCRVPDQVIEKRSVEDGGGIEFLPCNGGADDRENARTDHRANAQGCQRHRPEGFFESALRLFRIRNQLVDGLAGEKLVASRPGISFVGLVCCSG